MFTPNATEAAEAFDPVRPLHLLSIGLYFKEHGDPLAAAGMAIYAVDFARVGFLLGRYTPSTFGRICRVAEELGYRA